MLNELAKDDLKLALLGAAAVAAIGLAGGALMHPTLAEIDIAGPQMLAGVSGARSEGGYAIPASTTVSGGQVPEWVIGTDWTHPRTLAAEPDLQQDVRDVEREARSAEGVATTAEAVATPETELREAVSFPSADGGLPYPSDHPPQTLDEPITH